FGLKIGKLSHRTSIKDGLGRHIGSCGPLNRNFHKQFKGKWLIISGKVGDINTDITNSAYVAFSVDDSFNSPQASFIESEEDKLANLRQGQYVKAICIGNGDIAKTPMLKNCTLVE
ncbi:OB-fold protein, partial [Klebsiella sp. 10982]|uniref:OB-fold protein n=1 Tax=Klebsiella sp. 10982 TaxID=1196034 RepID=UPI00046EA02B